MSEFAKQVVEAIKAVRTRLDKVDYEIMHTKQQIETMRMHIESLERKIKELENDKVEEIILKKP